MQLERLYKRTVTGAVQVCDISHEGDTVTVSWGQLDGKFQSKTTSCKPKNTGRANATTAEEQAAKEAQAKWDRKLKENYSTDPDCPVSFELPMKISKYEDQASKLNYEEGVLATPKLNGVNITIRLINDELTYTSRGGEPRQVMPHQAIELKTVFNYLQTTELGGEMYKHGEYLEDITSATTKHNELTPELEFHIFAIPYFDGTYEQMSNKLTTAALMFQHLKYIKFVVPTIILSKEEEDEFYEQALANKYEGIVLCTPSTKYAHNKRLTTAMKRKPVLDGEFLTTGYKIDKNGHVVWTCACPAGSFSVKCKGTNEQRDAMAAKANELVGSWLNVEYETLSKYGKPLKPVGTTFRRCDLAGSPID